MRVVTPLPARLIFLLRRLAFMRRDATDYLALRSSSSRSANPARAAVAYLRHASVSMKARWPSCARFASRVHRSENSGWADTITSHGSAATTSKLCCIAATYAGWSLNLYVSFDTADRLSA